MKLVSTFLIGSFLLFDVTGAAWSEDDEAYAVEVFDALSDGKDFVYTFDVLPLMAYGASYANQDSIVSYIDPNGDSQLNQNEFIRAVMFLEWAASAYDAITLTSDGEADAIEALGKMGITVSGDLEDVFNRSHARNADSSRLSFPQFLAIAADVKAAVSEATARRRFYQKRYNYLRYNSNRFM